MVARIWHGWTTQGNADRYQRLLEEEVFPWIRSRRIPGFQGISLLRGKADDEVEFVTLMWFDSLQDIQAFAGPASTRAVVPESAQALLTRYDAHSTHYEVVAGGPGPRVQDPTPGG